MARTLTQIKTLIKTKAREFASLDKLLFDDDSGFIVGSIWGSIVSVFANAQLSFEQAADAVKEEISDIAAAAPSGNSGWIRAQILKFQYGDVVTIDPTTFEVGYTTLDTTKQIVTQCAVKVSDNNVVQIKVAKGSNPPQALLTAELDALKDYYYGNSSGSAQGVGFAGVVAAFTSVDADRIFIEGTIYYLGQYDPATVKTNVIAAIDAFLASFTDEAFDGVIRIQKLEDAIQAVDGVSRFVFATNGIRGRADATAFASASILTEGGFYETTSGYAIQEDTSGETFSDKISTTLETFS